MDKKFKSKAVTKVTSYLYKRFKEHKTIVCYGGNDLSWRRRYLSNVSRAIVDYALYGRCIIDPEAHPEYLKKLSSSYEEPEVKFRGCLAINPENNNSINNMKKVLSTALHDDVIDFENDVKAMLDVIVATFETTS